VILRFAELELTAVIFHNGFGQTQSQASSFADGLGGKKRLHDARPKFGRHTGPAIDDGENNGLFVAGDLKLHPAVCGKRSNGVEGVLEEVEENLGNLDFAAKDMQASVHNGGIQPHRMFAEALLAQLEGVLDNLAHGSALEGIGAAITGNLAEA
jgi:hypothetical protein